jgi:hypothetical protein
MPKTETKCTTISALREKLVNQYPKFFTKCVNMKYTEKKNNPPPRPQAHPRGINIIQFPMGGKLSKVDEEKLDKGNWKVKRYRRQYIRKRSKNK